MQTMKGQSVESNFSGTQIIPNEVINFIGWLVSDQIVRI
jgi:hypothetical protein